MLKDVIAGVCGNGRVAADDVSELRRAFYGDGAINADEAAALFEVNDACAEQDESWPVFFVEAIADYIVHQASPHGHVDETNAQWLVSMVGGDGRIAYKTEMEMLLKIFEQAKSVPDALSAYALDQVKQAVVTGEGPLRSGKFLEKGRVDGADVEMLRRILYAYGSGSNIGVTATEAEVLFDINDATLNADNDPAWSDLFAKAIASHLMFASTHVTVDRATALRREVWLGSPEGGVVDFIGEMVSSLRNIYAVATMRENDGEKGKREAYFAGLKSSENISGSEAIWLASRFNHDGRMSEAELAALTFIKREAVDIDPVLLPLFDKVA